MHMHKTILFQLALAFILALNSSNLMAQTDEGTTPQSRHRQYTKEHPLVYEDVWDLWPYSFLNDNGEPEGYNIDLIRLMMDRLNIPYVIKLKSSEETFNDLKSGKSDLTLGLAVGYHDEYGLYGKNAVTLFTQSVVTPKSKPVQIKTFRDLSNPGMQVIVNSNSMCYHLMLDYGWGDNAIPRKDIQDVIQQVSAREEGQIVWNTLTLKWLIHRYLIDNLQLTPVNMPHGEYKFMSNDQHLLDLLDEAYANLHLEDEIAPIENKWLYPERQEKEKPLWLWVLIGIASLLLIAAIVGFVSYQLRFRRVMKTNKQLNRRLALINETTKVRIWTYDVNAHEFFWRDENGRVAYTYTMEEFAQRYSEEDFKHLKDALDRLISQHKDAKGHEEEQVTLELKAKDMEDGDNEVRNFLVVVSVLRRDEHGKPSVLIGTKKDVTEARRLKRLEDERTLRYWSIFYSQDAAIILFDRLGVIQDISPKACELCNCDGDKLIKQRIHINDLFQLRFTDMSKVNGFHAIQVVNDVKIEYQLKTFYNDSNELLGIFAFCQKDQTNL